MSKELYAYLLHNFKLNINSIHGPIHWERVLNNGLLIAQNNALIDTYILKLFACIHDSKRENDFEDINHGLRAAKSLRYLRRLGLIKLTSLQQDKLHFACKYHSSKKTTTDLTIGACWDADRLELIKVKVNSSVSYFSTAEGKNIFQKRVDLVLQD